jgi:hypothetical protein
MIVVAIKETLSHQRQTLFRIGFGIGNVPLNQKLNNH